MTSNAYFRESNALASALVDVRGAATLDEVLDIADLDWQVSLHDMQYTPDPDLGPISMPDHFAIARSDMTPLGVVGKRYVPIQNADAFAPLAYLQAEGFIEGFDQAGILGDGQKVFIVARISEEMRLADKHDARILFSTTHDGSGAFNVRALAQRLFCANQIPNLNRHSTSMGISIRHTQSAQQRVAAVRFQVMAELSWIREYEDKYQTLLDTPARGGDVDEYVRVLAPMPEGPKVTDRMRRAADRKWEEIVARIYGKANQNIEGTWAAAFHGAVEYSDYDARGNNAERILLGRDIEFKREAWDLALQLATQ